MVARWASAASLSFIFKSSREVSLLSLGFRQAAGAVIRVSGGGRSTRESMTSHNHFLEES
jgi:hypothetical protein